MKDIAIYGAGGLGREVAAMIDRINETNEEKWRFIGFFDDGIEKGSEISHLGSCLGGIKELNNWPTPIDIALGFGNPKTIETISSKINNSFVEFPNIIYPNFFISDKESFKIGKGNIIMGCCVATVSVQIGNFNLLNGYITLGHDVEIGNYNVLMPGCRISGEVKMGNRNLIGAMAFVKQCVKIGDDVVLSPLSPLLRNPKNGNTYIGNPAKLFKF